MSEYIESLCSQIRSWAKKGELAQIRTLYIGGGTPSFVGQARLVELAYLLSLNIKIENVEEYTLEANPESLTTPMINDLFALGVNRLSLGVQSFIDSELSALGRIHTSSQAHRVIKKARGRFQNISIDLMCGLPGQTIDSWNHTLSQALSHDLEHISIYPLQLEEGTKFAEQAARAGQVSYENTELNEDFQADFMEIAASFLESQGYLRYEVASYAKPGYESRHNTCYWTGAPYLGLGKGAASMKMLHDGSRLRYTSDEEPELLSPEEALAEDLLLAMRMKQGVSKELLCKASLLLPSAPQLFVDLQELGLISYSQGRYQPTNRGWLMGNELYARIWSLV